MHYSKIFIIAVLFFSACQNAEETAVQTEGNFMEVAPSKKELQAISLTEQSEIIQDFFAISSSFFGDDFCFDGALIRDLILDSTSSEEWSKFEVSDNYLTIYSEDCDVMIEFMTFQLENEKRAFVSQMNRTNQQFNCLIWNNEKGKWSEIINYPKPELTEFFDDLSAQEAETVREYGSSFIYIHPKNNSATFVFSDWLMGLNMGEKQADTFDKEVMYEFELTTNNNRFEIEINDLSPGIEMEPHYIVAYAKDEKAKKRFEKTYDKIVTAFPETYILKQLVNYNDNNNNVFFPQDTFDLSYMEQFEPRNGFWFYKPGSEPLDLGSEIEIEAIIDQANEYFNSDE